MVSGSVDSGCHKLSENVWFVWSKTSYSGDVSMRDGRTTTTREDNATQPLDTGRLSFAIIILVSIVRSYKQQYRRPCRISTRQIKQSFAMSMEYVLDSLSEMFGWP